MDKQIFSEEKLRSLAASAKQGMAKEFYTKVNGTSFADKHVVQSVGDNEIVVLVPDLENEFDENAVKVVRNVDGEKIGYVPAQTAKDMSIKDNILRGDTYIAKVEVTGKDKENRGFNLKVLRFTK